MSTIYGSNTLIMGPSGTGKTHSARTLIESGIEVRAIMTEPRWSPLDEYVKTGQAKIQYIPPNQGGLSAMQERAKNLIERSWEVNTKTNPSSAAKKTYDQMYHLLLALDNFTDDATGKEYGPTDEWGPDVCLWLDSLTGINEMAKSAVTGGSVTVSQPQWGAAMSLELDTINHLCYNTKCFFVLVAHVEKVIDEVMGGQSISPLALGRKNAPAIPINFDDVILSRRDGGNFYWSTEDSKADTKFGYLPSGQKLEPSFKPLVEAWKSRRGE